jgi:hypothetical protein
MCSLYGVLPQEVAFRGQPQMQGGLTRFNVNFDSGAMRARFNPKDGQLYVVGLRGWQTTAVKNGCLQRVRYTGEKVRTPLDLKVSAGRVEVRFGEPLDAAVANHEPCGVWGGHLFVAGRIVLQKRRRGRPPRQARPGDTFPEIEVPEAYRSIIARNTLVGSTT